MFNAFIRLLKRLFGVSSNLPKTVGMVSNIRSFYQFTSDVKVSDQKYAIVDRDWLETEWYNYYRKVLDGLNIHGWSHDFDCDNFASLYCALLQVCHKAGNTTSDGISVGEFWYITEDGSGHAIVTAIVGDNQVIYIEPQSGSVLSLTDKERYSCLFVRF